MLLLHRPLLLTSREMGFETFKRQRLTPAREPYVTIQRKGIFSLNRAAYEALGSPESVELLYDRDERLIGIHKVDPSMDHAYIVRTQRGANWLISGRAFMNYYEVDVSEPRRRMAQMQGDVLVVDLKEPGTVVTSNRKQAQTRPSHGDA